MDEKIEVVRDGFKSLKLSSWLIAQCLDNGILHPTSVQYNCIPKILEGHDCISVSQTGTGKTIAFALPIIQKLSEDPHGYFALILSPTRELAMQIAEQFEIVGKPLNCQVMLLTGGVDMMYQGIKLISQPHIIVSTPGRLADYIESNEDFSLKTIKFLVLDEADRLLGGNFEKQLQVILNILPTKKQTLLFSATELDQVAKYISLQNVFTWSLQKGITVKELEHTLIFTLRNTKEAYLAHIIQEFSEKHPLSSIIVFTKTCKMCRTLSLAFNTLELKNIALHSGLSQKERKAALSKFKSKIVKLLIATDLVSRGLDIPTVDLVVNHNVPKDFTDYVHRVGRTARAGRKGIAVSLATPQEMRSIRNIQKQIGKEFSKYRPISETRVSSILLQVNVAVREAKVNLYFEDSEKAENL